MLYLRISILIVGFVREIGVENSTIALYVVDCVTKVAEIVGGRIIKEQIVSYVRGDLVCDENVGHSKLTGDLGSLKLIEIFIRRTVDLDFDEEI